VRDARPWFSFQLVALPWAPRTAGRYGGGHRWSNQDRRGGIPLWVGSSGARSQFALVAGHDRGDRRDRWTSSIAQRARTLTFPQAEHLMS
jgi:hypothetical protein